MQEVQFNTLKDERLAKVVFYLPAGFLVVMRRAEALQKFDKKYFAGFCARKKGLVLPCELKKDSFGYIDGKLVAIDYG